MNSQVKVHRHQPIEQSLRILKTSLFWEGTLDEVLRLRRFETPREKRIRKKRRNSQLERMAKKGHSPTTSLA